MNFPGSWWERLTTAGILALLLLSCFLINLLLPVVAVIALAWFAYQLFLKRRIKLRRLQRARAAREGRYI